jgi:LacI family transcriptional regulator
LLIDSTENKKSEIENVKSLCSQGVDGLIIAPTTNDFAYLERVVGKEFPIVFVDRIPANFNADCIMLSNTEGAQAATKHLIDKGHTDIGFIGFTYDGLDGTMNERVEGYKKAHIEAGLPVKGEYIKVDEGGTALFTELRHAKSYKMTEQLLATRISAVVCGNNLASIGVFSYLKENFIPMPERIAFITFDDEFWLTMATPSVSAVSQSAETYGILAAQRVLERINGKHPPFECFRLKPQLIIRQSC